MELQITFPEFLTVTIIVAIVAVAFHLIRKSIIKNKLAGITKYGEKVYKRGIPQIVGYDLSIEQISLGEEIYRDVASRDIYPFNKEQIDKYFSNNKIRYDFYPFHVDRKLFPSGFAGATYDGKNNMRLGILPFLHRTGWAHEMTHDLLREATGDSDHNHKQSKYWEMGLTGIVNTCISEALEERGWKL